jgi:hypothetical protein
VHRLGLDLGRHGARDHAPTFWFTAAASRSPRIPMGAGEEVM